MAVVLYDLVGEGDRRVSPHCWRVRMALAHKGLDCEAKATRFTEIAAIGDGCKTVPAIRDGERLVGRNGVSTGETGSGLFSPLRRRQGQGEHGPRGQAAG